MNLLIVDDELYVVRAIKAKIDWNKIGVDQVFMAFNTQKAKEIFQSEKVDMIITDIEMPQENGMQLMHWVRDHGYNAKAVCLTCHADFQYASEAIRLGFREYYVKPIDFGELETLIETMVQEIKAEQKAFEARASGKLWEYNKFIIERHFWEEVLFGDLGYKPQEIITQAARSRVDYYFEQEYGLIVFCVRKIYDREDAWQSDRGLMEYVLMNIAGELFISDDSGKGQIGWHEKYLWIILKKDAMEMVASQLQEFIEVCHQTAGAGVVAYVSDYVFGETLHEEYEKAVSADINNVWNLEGIVNINENSEAGKERKKIEFEDHVSDWHEMLDKKEYDLFLDKSRQWLEVFTPIERWQLEAYSQNLLQAVYCYLFELKIPASRLYEALPYESFEDISSSVDKHLEWIAKILTCVQQMTKENEKDSGIILCVKKYIQEHIDSRLKREEIAEHVFLSPGYLTRLFKQETGMTLFDFITKCKMECALELLKSSSYAIGEVAIQIGYDNFSYFSEIFKKHVGMSPSDYQKKCMSQ